MSKSRKKRSPREPISRILPTIRKRALTAYAAAKRAGISVDAVQRFLNAERGLTLASVDRLADALDLTLCPEDPKPGEGTRRNTHAQGQLPHTESNGR